MRLTQQTTQTKIPLANAWIFATFAHDSYKPPNNAKSAVALWSSKPN